MAPLCSYVRGFWEGQIEGGNDRVASLVILCRLEIRWLSRVTWGYAVCPLLMKQQRSRWSAYGPLCGIVSSLLVCCMAEHRHLETYSFS
jgi:hypothetical protein